MRGYPEGAKVFENSESKIIVQIIQGRPVAKDTIQVSMFLHTVQAAWLTWSGVPRAGGSSHDHRDSWYSRICKWQILLSAFPRSELISRSTKPSSSTLEWLPRLSSSSMEFPRPVEDSRCCTTSLLPDHYTHSGLPHIDPTTLDRRQPTHRKGHLPSLLMSMSLVPLPDTLLEDQCLWYSSSSRIRPPPRTHCSESMSHNPSPLRLSLIKRILTERTRCLLYLVT